MSKPSLDFRIARALRLVGDQGLPQDADERPVRNAPSPLKAFVPVVGARGERRQRRRRQTRPEVASDGSPVVHLSADGTWHDGGLGVDAGDIVRFSASGRLFLSRLLDVSVGPRTCVWYRIGDGPIARLPGEDGVIVAKEAGRLRLQAALPGAFGSPNGETNRESPPPPMRGKVHVKLGVTGVADAPADLTPPGWHYLWRIGDASIFSTCDDSATLCCDTQGDVGILRYPVARPLTDDLELRWDWLVDELPSRLPEHVQPTHDYLSIAVEFDNGLDLTYMWSCGLAAGTIFQCPLPWWDKHETHWVLRTPSDGLGRWIGEARSITDDYRRAIGGPLPTRIVAIWLIANSVFQGGQGRCRYRRIVLEDHGGRVEIARAEPTAGPRRPGISVSSPGWE